MPSIAGASSSSEEMHSCNSNNSYSSTSTINGNLGTVSARLAFPPAPQSHFILNGFEEYDGYFTSSLVSEKKRFLWEIKDADKVLDNGVMRAMHFEFEMGRLGSMEKHLPRKSRWRVSFDLVHEEPELTIQLIFPEDKIIFYRLFAQVISPDNVETSITSRKDDINFTYRQASVSRTATSANRYLMRPDFGRGNLEDWSLKDYIRPDGSLCFKIEMEIMEDSSTS